VFGPVSWSSETDRRRPLRHRHRSLPYERDLENGAKRGVPDFRGKRIFLLQVLDAIVRISVAEYARDLVFLHAGVVGWRGRGITPPRTELSGQIDPGDGTDRAGAEYYSDDLRHSRQAKPVSILFPRPISMRTRDGKFDTYELDAKHTGSVAEEPPNAVGMVFLTGISAQGTWRPHVLGTGEAILATIRSPFTLKADPQLCLKGLEYGLRQMP